MSNWVIGKTTSVFGENKEKGDTTYIVYNTNNGKSSKYSGCLLSILIRGKSLEVANVKLHGKTVEIVGEAEYNNRQRHGLSVTYSYLIELGSVGTQYKFVTYDNETDTALYGIGTMLEVSKLLGKKLGDIKFSYKCTEKEESKDLDRLVSIKKLFGRDNKVELDFTDSNKVVVKNLESNGMYEFRIPYGVDRVEKVQHGINKLGMSETVKEIGEHACEDIDDMYELEVGAGVEKIGAYAFRNSSVREIKFNGEVREIGKYAFDYSDLTGELESKATKIGNRAFSYNRIRKAKLHGVRVLGAGALEGNYWLTDVDLGDKVEVIAPLAFKNCERLKEITVPKTCKFIGEHAFDGCKGLRKVVIPVETELRAVLPRRAEVVYY